MDKKTICSERVRIYSARESIARIFFAIA